MYKKQLTLIAQTLLALLFTQVFVLLAMHAYQSATAPILPIPEISAYTLLAGFFIMAAILFLLVRFVSQRIVFEIIFCLSIFSGVWFLSVLVSPEFGFLIALGLTLLRYVLPYIIVQNILLLLGIAGVSSAFGSAFSWPTAMFVLLVLAIYDIIAVYGTKHMVAMFNGLLQKGVVFAIIIPESARWLFSKTEESTSKQGFYFLGTGDLALPGIFVASVARDNFGLAIGAAIGSLVGMLATDLIFSRGQTKPMPALPPIVLGTILGFFIAMLIL